VLREDYQTSSLSASTTDELLHLVVGLSLALRQPLLHAGQAISRRNLGHLPGIDSENMSTTMKSSVSSPPRSSWARPAPGGDLQTFLL